MSYIPPIMNTGSVVSAGVSMSVSSAGGELARIGPVSKETAAIEREKAIADNQRWTIIASSVASAAMITGVIAMYVEASAITIIAFIFPLFMAPTVIHQRRKLNKIPTFVEELNAIRLLVNDFRVQNNRLMQEQDKLEQQCSELKQVETQFETIVRNNHKDVTTFKQLAHENGQLVRNMKICQETQTMQILLTAVLSSDTNKDFCLSDDEIDKLVVRLKCMPYYNNSMKHVDANRLRAVFRESTQKKSVMTLTKLTAELLDEEELELSKDSSSSSRSIM